MTNIDPEKKSQSQIPPEDYSLRPDYWVNRPLNDEEKDWKGEQKDWVDGYVKSVDHPHRALIINALKKLTPFESIVEVGANCGPNLFVIRKEFPNTKVAGIDLTKFKSLENHKAQEETVRIISLRSLEPLYDVESFIKAAARVASRARNVEFIVAGDGSERERLEGLAYELGLQQELRFIGRYDAKNLPQMLAEADIYVSTSLSESGLAASTSEAMAAGLPLVVSDSGDNKVWIEGKGGFVVPLKDPEALAEKIMYLIENPEARKNFGAYNRQITFEKNNYHKEMEKMEKIYERLLQK